MHPKNQVIYLIIAFSVLVFPPGCSPTKPPSSLCDNLAQALDTVTLRARLASTPDQIRAFLQSANAGPEAKLVFVNGNYLYYIDFSEAAPTIKKLPLGSAAGPICPVISPDGAYIAFATGVPDDGEQTAVSTAWILNLTDGTVPVRAASPAYVPRFVQNATAPTIIYSTSASPAPGKTYLWDGNGKVMKKEIAGGMPGAEQEVYAGGSYFGGLSWDERYLATAWLAGPNSYLLDLQNAARGPAEIHTLKVKKLSSNADTTIKIGTCNPSVSSSRIFTDCMMYFDFGSGAISAAGCSDSLLGSWGMHQRIFITRIDSTILRVYDPPSDIITVQGKNATGEIVAREWDNPEWSNHPYLAVAAVKIDRLWKDKTGAYTHTQNNEFIYAINLKDSTSIRLVETTDSSYVNFNPVSCSEQISFQSRTDIRWPWLWARVPAAFKEDSLWLARGIGRR
ncbi:MAG: hypothetical protein PHC61_19240 [Chitinivibrionales bacterium]|nr:hypothetical protein [Chitinivibrionales bacterium]